MKHLLSILADSGLSGYTGLPPVDAPSSDDSGFLTHVVLNHHWLIVPFALIALIAAFVHTRRGDSRIADPILLMVGDIGLLWSINALTPVSCISAPLLALGLSSRKPYLVFVVLGVIFFFGGFC